MHDVFEVVVLCCCPQVKAVHVVGESYRPLKIHCVCEFSVLLLSATWLKIHYECEFNFRVPDSLLQIHVSLGPYAH